MFDEQRKELSDKINVRQLERAALEAEFGQVWDTEQLKQDFVVHGFMAPFCAVTRKSDNVEGALCFQHLPRYYWGFTPIAEKVPEKLSDEAKKGIEMFKALQKLAGISETDESAWAAWKKFTPDMRRETELAFQVFIGSDPR